MKKSLLCMIASCMVILSYGQNQYWTPEEQLELFGYCEKEILMKELGISAETAKKIGEINYWATLQKLKIEANTNDTFATANEVNQEVLKKYKALSITGDKAKALLGRNAAASCAVTELRFNKNVDTVAKAALVAAYKVKYRKKLIDQLGINGRQADLIIEAEVWRQKEALVIDKIELYNFDRIRKTVQLNNEFDKKIRLIDLTEQQKNQAIEFFIQNQL